MIKIPAECYKEFGADLDGCSTQEREGCGACRLAKRVPTNADRIRGMTDEELAGYVFDLGNGSEYCYGHCAYQDDCAIRGLDNDTCIRGVIDWLRQPAETEGE